MKNTIKYELNNTYNGYGEIKGVDFTLLHRKKDICLFKRSDGYYEVIQLKHQKYNESMIGGNKVIFKEKEIYPTGDSWDGKCVSTYERALEFYNGSN